MFEQAFKNIDDVLWKEAGCTTELDYTEQTSWLLFLKYPYYGASGIVDHVADYIFDDETLLISEDGANGCGSGDRDLDR